ncbi:MAG: glycosyltransferase [Peptoanaerobacter stomatis]|uniref:glycosyltransferase n=1 Tax=Peptoanaerobacter stomatis TaxID=796937 RepID=UPI003FA14A10
MKKILYTASRISHILNFHMPYINYFKNKGYTIHILSEGTADINVDKIYNIPFEKKITSINNILTIKTVKHILHQEQYDLIITNTSLASFIVRIAKQISKAKNHGRLINISHGYLFSKNTPLLKKILYVTAEKLCVKSTDLLITMNKEDFELANKYKLCKHKIENIKGMGITPPPIFTDDIKQKTRLKYNINSDDILITYAGELSKRKNQIFLIQSMKNIIKKIPHAKLLLAGNGELYDFYKQEINRLDLENHIVLAGFVSQIKELIFSSDIIISSSKSEGLPFNIMEAMSLKIPVIASNVKGHNDLIKDGYNGYLFEIEDKKTEKSSIKKTELYNNSVNSYNSKIIDELTEKLLKIINDKNINVMKENEAEFIKDYMIDRVLDYNIKLLNILD